MSVISHIPVITIQEKSRNKRDNAQQSKGVEKFSPDDGGFHVTLLSIRHRLPSHGLPRRHLLFLQAFQVVRRGPLLINHKQKQKLFDQHIRRVLKTWAHAESRRRWSHDPGLQSGGKWEAAVCEGLLLLFLFALWKILQSANAIAHADFSNLQPQKSLRRGRAEGGVPKTWLLQAQTAIARGASKRFLTRNKVTRSKVKSVSLIIFAPHRWRNIFRHASFAEKSQLDVRTLCICGFDRHPRAQLLAKWQSHDISISYRSQIFSGCRMKKWSPLRQTDMN